MKRVFVFILLIFISLASIAQIQVKEGSFRRIVNYVMDDKDEHMDGNYMPMALIKISTENINAEERNKLYFKGNRATDFHVEPKIGELYLYISAEAATVLEIKHPDYGKTMFTFPEPLCDFCAYELVVQYIPVAPIINSDLVQQKQYLIVKADQPDALIYIDDIYVDKQFVHKQFEVATTHTWRIECDLFRTESGTVTITEEENVVEVKMQPEYGFLNVSTTPENGAHVYIDDSLVGTTPYKSDKLSVGTYTVRVMKDDYKVKEDKVVVKDNETAEAMMQMLSVFVDVALNADSDSDIYVDDVYKGRGQWSGKLREGSYIVEARKENHRTVRKSLELVAGNRETMSLGSPEPVYGSLNITSTPTGATVYIDGKIVGQTPMDIDISLGIHEVLVKRGNLYEAKSIDVSKNFQSSYHFTPKKEPIDKYLENGVSFITLNGAYSVAPQTSFGITYGQVRKVGWFVSAMTNFNFSFSGEDSSNLYNEAGPYVFSGRSSSARLSVMAGGILKVAGPVYVRLGVGYGMRVKCWEINDKWYEYYTDTYKGIDLSAGMQLNFRRVTLTADVVTTNFKTMEFKIGMGLNWKKR